MNLDIKCYPLIGLRIVLFNDINVGFFSLTSSKQVNRGRIQHTRGWEFSFEAHLGNKIPFVFIDKVDFISFKHSIRNMLPSKSVNFVIEVNTWVTTSLQSHNFHLFHFVFGLDKVERNFSDSSVSSTECCFIVQKIIQTSNHVECFWRSKNHGRKSKKWKVHFWFVSHPVFLINIIFSNWFWHPSCNSEFSALRNSFDVSFRDNFLLFNSGAIPEFFFIVSFKGVIKLLEFMSKHFNVVFEVWRKFWFLLWGFKIKDSFEFILRWFILLFHLLMRKEKSAWFDKVFD